MPDAVLDSSRPVAGLSPAARGSSRPAVDLGQPFFDPGAECRSIAREFGECLGSRPRGATHCDPGIVPSNIVVMLPYTLADAAVRRGDVGAGDMRRAAGSMALGNVFGAAHFLTQDKWVDGDEEVDPAGARLSDVCLCRFVRAYQGLFPPDSQFWTHFDRYLRECFDSITWEQEVLQSGDGSRAVADESLTETLVRIGRRMSPLKATVAAVGLLARRPEFIVLGDRIVEDFHAAYQLADDIEDMATDLARGRWSVAAWILTSGSGLTSPAEVAGAAELLSLGARSGALEKVVDLICARYSRAAGDAAELGAPILEAHLRESLSRAERVLGSMARRLTITERGSGGGSGSSRALLRQADRPSPMSWPAVGARRLHVFDVGGEAFVYDRRSGLFFEADGTAVGVIGWLRTGGSGSDLDVLRMNHGSSAVHEAVEEIACLTGPTGARFTPDRNHNHPERPSLEGLSSVALNVAAGCNLACDYCYLRNCDNHSEARDHRGDASGGAGPRAQAAGLMTDDVAFRAVDLLFEESFGGRDLSVVFFGGEPLLNAGLIARTARYARGRAEDNARRISFHLTTNGTLLTPNVAGMLHDEGVRILVSLDGPPACHDAHRSFPSGAGSHEIISDNIAALPEGLRLGARATLTAESVPLVELVSHLRNLGFGVVHLAPVSDGPMDGVLADRLSREYEDLARMERDAVLRGESPTAGCFLEPLVSLGLGRQRLAPCGAGTRYVSVASDGRLFLCHRFAGDERYGVGDIENGLDRFAVGRLLGEMSRRSSACQDCWALGLCGGACFHDVMSVPEPFGGPESDRCRVRLRVLELAMWFYASLPQHIRDGVLERARAMVKPEMTGAGVALRR